MASLSESRTEFLAADVMGSTPNSIKYSRKGGVFVNTKRAILLFLLAVACMAIVGVIVHYVDKNTRMASEIAAATEESSVKVPSDKIQRDDAAKLRLPRHVTPVHYHLQLRPFLQTGDKDEFTFKGHVSITVICHNSTYSITLNAKDLQLDQQVNISIAANSTLARSEEVTSPTTSIPVSSETSSSNSGSETVSSAATVTADVRESTPSPSGRRRKRRTPHRHRSERRRSVDTTTISATIASGDTPRVTSLSVDNATETVTFCVEPPLMAGTSYVLDISFSGKLQDSLYGFYRSSYLDKSGTTKWMGTTHFEPLSARQAFPCFDEPDMKARFEISIAHTPNMTSISNMPKRSTTREGDGSVWDHFEVSPIMSTYLVAYIVAPEDFTTTDQVPANKPDIRVFARKDLLPQAGYAMDIAPPLVQFYNQYFNVAYPLPQMLIAAIPDFSAGAMENWGLITFREARVLHDPLTSTTRDKNSILWTVAHEIAHQWFGNLVTMKWWNDLWLNEGFASYMEYLGANHVEPGLGMLDQIVLEDVHVALSQDSLRSTRPVSTTVETPGQISEQFDAMAYKKGASLIRMLNYTLTEPVFRAGITDYLSKWQYKNAAQDDLWEALTEACRRHPQVQTLPANLTVKDVMDTWTLQKGYPVVNVTRYYALGTITLSQVRFALDNGTNTKEPPQLWNIPISYVDQNQVEAGNLNNVSWFWLYNSSALLSKNFQRDKWVLFNVHETGYFRVNYDDRNWRLLSEHLEKAPAQLPAVTRAQLLDDALNLARAGLLGYEAALNMTRYLTTGEDHYVPWSAALKNLGFIKKQLRQNKVYGEFQKYVRTILSNVSKSLGYEHQSGDSHMQKLLRGQVLSWMSRMGDKPTISWARNLFSNWMASSDPDNTNPIPVDFRANVYCTAIKEGDVEEWEFVLKRYAAAVTRPSEAITLLKSLACTRREWLVHRLLNMLVWESTFRQQDTIFIWRSMAANSMASHMGFSYLLENWDHIYERYSKTPSFIRTVLRGSVEGLTSEHDLKNLREFQTKNQDKLSYAERTMKQLIERLELEVQWFNRHYTAVAKWLTNFNSK